MDNKKYEYWWASVQNGFSIQLMRIAQQVESEESLYRMDYKELINIEGISENLANKIIDQRKNWDLDYEYEKFLKMGIRFIPWYSEDYPMRLRMTNGHPYALFVKGQLPRDNIRSVSIIGARNCSEYGRMMAERFGHDLAECGVQIISGMAYGIDGIGQEAALKAGGSSYAVLGCGVNICYPRSNRSLYNSLIDSGGVISEYGIYSEAKSCMFPPRNRIISALSDVVLVVEAREKSGTMITVDMALEQGREVAVIPGRVTDPLSTGCIKLIKQGASPVTSVDDILYMLGVEANGKKKRRAVTRVEMTEIEKRVYGVLELYAMSVGTISDKLNMDIRELLQVLLALKMKGVASEVSTGNYVKAKECLAVCK